MPEMMLVLWQLLPGLAVLVLSAAVGMVGEIRYGSFLRPPAYWALGAGSGLLSAGLLQR